MENENNEKIILDNLSDENIKYLLNKHTFLNIQFNNNDSNNELINVKNSNDIYNNEDIKISINSMNKIFNLNKYLLEDYATFTLIQNENNNENLKSNNFYNKRKEFKEDKENIEKKTKTYLNPSKVSKRKSFLIPNSFKKTKIKKSINNNNLDQNYNINNNIPLNNNNNNNIENYEIFSDDEGKNRYNKLMKPLVINDKKQTTSNISYNDSYYKYSGFIGEHYEFVTYFWLLIYILLFLVSSFLIIFITYYSIQINYFEYFDNFLISIVGIIGSFIAYNKIKLDIENKVSFTKINIFIEILIILNGIMFIYNNYIVYNISNYYGFYINLNFTNLFNLYLSLYLNKRLEKFYKEFKEMIPLKEKLL